MTTHSPDFFDLRVRAELLDLCDDIAGAASLRAQSLEIAREVDLTCYGYQLLWRNRVFEAIDIFERNAALHPESWNAWDSLAEAWLQQGDAPRAIDCYMHASQLVDDGSERQRMEHRIRELVAFGAIAS